MSTRSTLNPDDCGPVSTTQLSLEVVLAWVFTSSSDPIPAHWVPGASEQERQRLGALGQAVGAFWSSQGGRPKWLNEVPSIAKWTEPNTSVPHDVTSSLAVIGTAGPDAVARLYELVVKPEARRHLGTFFTPSIEAEWMVNRWSVVFGTPQSVVDIGAGVGVFTNKAHFAWPGSQIIPIDVNPVALGLTSLLSSPRSDKDDALLEQMKPVLGDFAAWSQKDFKATESPRLILGNPPYTRLQLIPREDRSTLRAAAGSLCGSRASLSALMLGAALSVLGLSDGVCLLLPAQWLESDYAVGLREWLWQARERRIELHLFESRLFRDAQVDAVALFVGPREAGCQHLHIGLAARVEGIVSSLTRDLAREGDSPHNWRQLFYAEHLHPSPAGVPLNTLGTVQRGVATGANNYFTLTADEAAEAEIPARVLAPYVQRTRDHGGLVVGTSDLQALGHRVKRFMLVLNEEDALLPPVAAYLAQGIRHGINRRHITSSRKYWFAVGAEAKVPDLIFSASARVTFAVLENRAQAVIANNLYGLSWKVSTSPAVRTAVTNWLRTDEGQDALMTVSRHHAEGLRKLEVRALQNLIVPSHVIAAG